MKNDTPRVGLAIMRLQPFHLGHAWIIGQMIAECETVIIGIGSTQAALDFHNPWSFEDRKQMLRNVYGDRIKILPVADLGTESTTTDWCEYVLGKIKKLGLPDPTDYFTGSQADSIYYNKVFFTQEEIKEKTKAYYDSFFTPSMGPPIREEPLPEFKQLHIRHRDANPFLSATELRTFLKLGSDDWKDWVPRVNHTLVEKTFPSWLITG